MMLASPKEKFIGMHRKRFIESLFEYLQPGTYLWLKALPEHPVLVPEHSDIDLLVTKDALQGLIDFAGRSPLVMRSRVTRKSSVVYLELYFTDGSYLQLDLLTALVRKGLEYLPLEYLFAQQLERNGVSTCTPEVLLEHVLLFNFLNGSGLPARYAEYFLDFPLGDQQRLLGFIAGKYGIRFDSFRQMCTFRPAIKAGFLSFLRRQPANRFWNRMARTIAYARDTAGGARSGCLITFTGVDGAGKTTLLNELTSVLTEKYRRKVVVLRHRPSVLPILSAFVHGRQKAESMSAERLPRQGANVNRLSSLLRFIYYYTDYLVGQAYVRLRYQAQGYVVLYDRYYFDFIVDPRRSNIQIDEGLTRRMYRFVAEPDLNLFLYAEPEVILQRKKELPSADIVQLTRRYQDLFGELDSRGPGRYLCLENNDKAATMHAIVHHCAQIL